MCELDYYWILISSKSLQCATLHWVRHGRSHIWKSSYQTMILCTNIFGLIFLTRWPLYLTVYSINDCRQPDIYSCWITSTLNWPVGVLTFLLDCTLLAIFSPSCVTKSCSSGSHLSVRNEQDSYRVRWVDFICNLPWTHLKQWTRYITVLTFM